MIHVRAFFIGIIIVGIGIYFGDPIPKEFSIETNNTVQFTENIYNKNREVEGEVERVFEVPLYIDMFIQ